MRRSPPIPHTARCNCYEAGKLARDLGRDKTPSPGLGGQRRSWWLAGWNDRDIELQVAESNRQKSMTSFFQEYALKVQNEDVQTSTEPAATPAPDHINIPACDYRIDMEQN